MRKIATIFLALLCFSPTWAKQLTQEEAWKVARSFLTSQEVCGRQEKFTWSPYLKI